MTDLNVSVMANVMTVQARAEDDIAYLPGDLAAKVYGHLWLTPKGIRKHLTPHQLVEYEQYLVCLRCSRPCAGTCDSSG
jgi:hypothetical protein